MIGEIVFLIVVFAIAIALAVTAIDPTVGVLFIGVVVICGFIRLWLR